MKAAPFLVASAVLGITTGFVAAPVEAKVRVVPYSKAGNWTVRAVYAASGRFDHCSANARYRSGTRISIIVYRSGNWRLWFSHKDWPDRGNAPFPATVRVDNHVVLSQNGRYKGRNAYIDLGAEISRVKALMRGRAMSITTPAGTSTFSLTGTNLATRQVAGCWKAHYRRPAPSGGAFGSANNNNGGAFGGGGVAQPRTSKDLSRAGTLEIATRYLSKAPQAYSILPQEKSPLKYFTVNWRFQDGSIGGMRVFRDTSVAVDKLLGTLLSDQAKNCKGRNASNREPAKSVKGRRIVSAKGVCETSKGSILNITYKVAEIGGSMVMMIMEVRSTGGSAGGEKNRAPGKDDAVYVPGPSEL